MAALNVQVSGMAEALAALKNQPTAFRGVLVEAIETGAAIIESEAKRRAPYDEGDLEKSITTEIAPDGLEAKIGTNLFYARFVEFGTIDTPAQPFLFLAYRTGAQFVRRHLRAWGEGAGWKYRRRRK